MLARIKKGLGKTRDAFKNKFENLFGGREINQEFFDELEEILISADVGVETTMKIVELHRERLGVEKIRERSAARRARNSFKQAGSRLSCKASSSA